MISANLRYLDKDSEPPISIMTLGGEEQSRGDYTDHRLPINNLRQWVGPTSLDQQGFELCKHTSVVKDFYDDALVKECYYEEIADLLKTKMDAREMVVFDHNTRAESRLLDRPTSTHEPVQLVHNDFTRESGLARVERELGAVRAAELADHRLAIINVWRPIRGPVRSKPLAFCDAQTVVDEDLVSADMVYEERKGSELRAHFNPNHRWYYLPEQKTDEVLLIKVCDSAGDGRAYACLHSAIDDPTTPREAPPRESIELRVMAFF